MGKLKAFLKSSKNGAGAGASISAKGYRTEQIAHYFLRLSMNQLMKGRNGRMPVINKPFISSDILNHWLYMARLISEDVDSYVKGDEVQPIHFDESVVRRFKTGLGHDELEIEREYLFHVAFPSIDKKWGHVKGSLLDVLFDTYRAEGYEKNLDWSGFEQEHLPIDSLTQKERELLDAIWTMLQDESLYSITTMILQSQPYKFAKIRGEKVILASN